MGMGAGLAAARAWQAACDTLLAPHADAAWEQLVAASPSDAMWHSLRNCVSYQAGVWQNLLSQGISDVIQPAAFLLALVLRHTPADVTTRLLHDLLHTHPQSQHLTAYVQALLTDDEERPPPPPSSSSSPSSPCPCPAPLRDLQLFGDCELSVLAASREEYDAHAKLVRAEYSKLNNQHYVELRIKVLNQFSQIPKLFHTPEFECFEAAARDNIKREICTLREHLHATRNE